MDQTLKHFHQPSWILLNRNDLPNGLMIKMTLLGLLVITVVIGIMPALAETKILSPFKQYSSGIPIDEIQCSDDKVLMESPRNTPACVNEGSVEKLSDMGFVKVETVSNASDLKSNGMESKTITIQSNSLDTFDNSTAGVGELYGAGNPIPICVLPSSISLQVPDRVQIGQTFDVTVTSSFELTQQQLDDYNETYRTEFDNARELWDTFCYIADWEIYSIKSHANYDLSGTDLSYYGKTILEHYYPPFEVYSHNLTGLTFDGNPTTFQMTINEPVIYLASDIHDRENLDYLKYDSGSFTVHATTLQPYADNAARVYTSIDDGIVTLSEFEPSRAQARELEDLEPDEQFVPYVDYANSHIMPHHKVTPSIPSDGDVPAQIFVEGSSISIVTEKSVFKQNEKIKIQIANSGTTLLTFSSSSHGLMITDLSGIVIYRPMSMQAESHLEPGEKVEFSWNQIKNDGDAASEGLYKISAKGFDSKGNNVEKSTIVTIWK